MTDSIVRRRASDIRVFGAAGYALALQVGHPTIAAGVRDHSNFVADPWGRFFGTIDFVNLLVYGSPAQIERASKNLREMHRNIRGTDLDGTKYAALEPTAYAWVHGTLGEAIVRGHHVFGQEFTVAEKDAFWTEWLELGARLGVRDGDLPETWPAFQQYLHDMIDNVLVHTDMIDVAQNTAARAVGGSPFRWLPAPVWGLAGRPLGHWGAFLGRGTSGPKLREKFGIEWTDRDQKRFARIAAIHRAATPVLIPPLRKVGPLTLKIRKNEIARGPFLR